MWKVKYLVAEITYWCLVPPSLIFLGISIVFNRIADSAYHVSKLLADVITSVAEWGTRDAPWKKTKPQGDDDTQ